MMGSEKSIDLDPSSIESGPEENVPLPLELNEKEPSEFTLQACLVLVGAFAAMFCSVGFINAFGVFEEYYTEHLLTDKSPSTIAWLGSFELFIMFAATFPFGYLLDRYGPRILLPVGGVITLFGLFMMSISKKYYQLFLTQALLLGIGISLIIIPAFATVPRYFVKRRGIALGLVVSGSSIGGVVWPIVLRQVLYKIGFGWGVRISAFIMLPLLALACLCIKQPNVPAGTIRAKPKPDITIIKHPVLILLAIGLFLIFLGIFAPFFYITSWTVSLGLDANMAFYFVSILNAASVFGRIIPGLLADKLGPFNMMILSAGTSGLVCMCWTKATTIGGIAVFSLAYGFTSGAVISLQGMCAASIAKPEQFGTAVGFVMAFLSIAGLIGTPIQGQLMGAFGYLGIALFSGLAMMLGMLILIIAKLKKNPAFLAKA